MSTAARTRPPGCSGSIPARSASSRGRPAAEAEAAGRPPVRAGRVPSQPLAGLVRAHRWPPRRPAVRSAPRPARGCGRSSPPGWPHRRPHQPPTRSARGGPPGPDVRRPGPDGGPPGPDGRRLGADRCPGGGRIDRGSAMSVDRGLDIVDFHLHFRIGTDETIHACEDAAGMHRRGARTGRPGRRLRPVRAGVAAGVELPDPEPPAPRWQDEADRWADERIARGAGAAGRLRHRRRQRHRRRRGRPPTGTAARLRPPRPVLAGGRRRAGTRGASPGTGPARVKLFAPLLRGPAGPHRPGPALVHRPAPRRAGADPHRPLRQRRWPTPSAGTRQPRRAGPDGPPLPERLHVCPTSASSTCRTSSSPPGVAPTSTSTLRSATSGCAGCRAS